MVYVEVVIVDRYTYWSLLRKVHNDYIAEKTLKQNSGAATPDFIIWMRRNWGIVLGVESGLYTGHFDIVDQAKYIHFLLKYQ